MRPLPLAIFLSATYSLFFALWNVSVLGQNLVDGDKFSSLRDLRTTPKTSLMETSSASPGPKKTSSASSGWKKMSPGGLCV